MISRNEEARMHALADLGFSRAQFAGRDVLKVQSRFDLPVRPFAGLKQVFVFNGYKQTAFVSIADIYAGVVPELGGEVGIDVAAAEAQLKKRIGSGCFR